MTLRVELIETSSLGDRSYVVADGDGDAVVIDPQRDIDRVAELADARGLTITHVLETHLHNDYVSGGLELSRSTGAEYVVPTGEGLGYPARRVNDGDVIDAGRYTLHAIHTPGHTREHTSYALHDDAGRPVGVFTGGSMLFDSTGRTDLLGDENTRRLSVDQYRSVRRLATKLPSEAAVYPTHGFGSFCSATAVGRDESTIGEQRDANPALTQDEAAFVELLLTELSDYPAYYEHMGVINRDGPPPVDLSAPVTVQAEELRRRIESGQWVVDIRSRTAFAAGHLAGAYGFELSDSFVTYLGWLFTWGDPLALIADDAKKIATARRELVRIGIDGVAAAVDDVTKLAGGADLRAYRVADFAALATEIRSPGVVVLDVRRDDEFRQRRVHNAVNIPIHELDGRVGEIPAGDVWVHCASGYRASVAASILDRRGRTVVLIDDDFATAKDIGLTE